MRRMLLIILIVFTLPLSSPGVGNYGERINRVYFDEDIDFNNVELADALMIISKVTGVSIVSDSESSKDIINLYVSKNQNLGEILDIMKVTNGYNIGSSGSTLIVTKKNITGKESTTVIGKVVDVSGEPIDDARVELVDSGVVAKYTQGGGDFIFRRAPKGVYILKVEKDGYETNGDAIEIKEGENVRTNITLKESESSISLNRNSGGTARGGTTGEDTEEYGKVSGDNGEQEITARVKIKHGEPGDIVGVIGEVIGTENITARAFDKLNMVVLKGVPGNVITAKKLIEDLDQPQKQVRISIQILEVSDDLTEELGIDWNLTNKSDGVAAAGSEGTSLAKSLGSLAIDFVDVFNDGGALFNTTVDLLKSTDDITIRSIPSVVTINGEAAEFKATEEVIVGEIEEEDDDGNSTKQPLFEEAGTLFTVTPKIRENPDGKDSIRLDISTEVSEFNTIEGYDGEAGKQKSNLDTTIYVKDGEPLFIGGLKKTKVDYNESRVPILGDIPIFGLLFRNYQNTDERAEIYIQIVAEIITDSNKNGEIPIEKFRPGITVDTTGRKKVYPELRRINKKQERLSQDDHYLDYYEDEAYYRDGK